MPTSLALAILLASGFFAARLGRLLRLPAVTGYIAAGVVLGPMGTGLVDPLTIGGQLEHFNQLALMLISFGIGEHLEFRRIAPRARLVAGAGLGEITLAALAVGTVTYAAGSIGGASALHGGEKAAAALILAAIAVATAPAATMHVIAELKAAGRLSSTILQVVAVDNVCALLLFGAARAAGHHLLGHGGDMLSAAGGIAGRILLALVLGGAGGLVVDLLIHNLKSRGEMLTAGLAMLLLTGELARYTGLSPLLCGMAAGCAIVNRDRRDVRLFRALNAFEPPIYVLFFTLAGCHLETEALATAGWLGVLYFAARVAGKGAGAWLGARLAGHGRRMRRSLALSLVPQAGLAIGLVILVDSDPGLAGVARVVTPVVLSGVLLAELFGPVMTRAAVRMSGEARGGGDEEKKPRAMASQCELVDGNCALVPWSWPKLAPAAPGPESVLVGASHRATVAGLVRMGALLAHHRQRRLVCAHIVPLKTNAGADEARGNPAEKRAVPGGNGRFEPDPGTAPSNAAVLQGEDLPSPEGEEGKEVFALARQAAGEINYPLEEVEFAAEDVSRGLLDCARREKSRILVLGCPLEGTESGFRRVVDRIAQEAEFRIVVIRFSGVLHTERILMPVTGMEGLEQLKDIVAALAAVGEHRITILRLLRSDATPAVIQTIESRMERWARAADLASPVECRAVATDARVEAIREEAEGHDLIVMTTGANPVRRYIFGSLASDVARSCRKPMMLVYQKAGMR